MPKHRASLSYSIHKLFQLTFKNSKLPKEWKTHCIIPIHKSGDKSLVSNYRPISLLPTVSKVLERLVHQKILPFLLNSISLHQFGFLPNRSTLQQMLLFIDKLLYFRDQKTSVDVIYLDIRKAFDTVSHELLLSKLKSLGIAGELLLWFKAYLTDRIQCVRVNNAISDFMPVISGVPQGSILGPLLFVLFINNLPTQLKSAHTFLFADDTKCLQPIRCPEDALSLQTDLDSIFQWSKISNLTFNESKCVHLHFWNFYSSEFDYTIDSKLVSCKESTKDLGILITNSLNWSLHYNHIIAKSYRMLGLLRRTFSTNNIVAKRKLYISLVRSQMMYCSQIWRPFLIKDILDLERVQRRASKHILSDFTSSYKARLLKLNLLPIMYTLELNDLTFFIKSIFFPSNQFNIFNHVTFSSTNTRSSTQQKLIHRISSTKLHFHSYFIRIVRLWNCLPYIDLSLPFPLIKRKLFTVFWDRFVANFDDQNPCSFHYQCPCSKCLAYPYLSFPNHQL